MYKASLHQARDFIRATLLEMSDSGIPAEPIMLHSSPGVGKALPYSEKVMTPSGYVTMEDIKTGDKVTGADGDPTKILYKSEQGIRPIYKMTFRDGTSVMCDGDHLWRVRSRRSGSPWKNLTTKELMNRKLRTYEKDDRSKDGGDSKRYNYWVPAVSPVLFTEKEQQLKIHPYVVGALLGDGGMTGDCIKFVNPEIAIIEKLDRMLPEDYKVSHHEFRNGAYHVGIVRKSNNVIPFKQLIEENYPEILGKSTVRQIPSDYMYASVEERKTLFEGLSDTDGCYKYDENKEKTRLVGVDLSNEKLHQQMEHVVRSIGIRCTSSTRDTGYNNGDEYIHCGTGYRLFILKSQDFEGIASIEYSHDENAACIAVDNESKLFVTNGFKVTHNSEVTNSLKSDQEIVEAFENKFNATFNIWDWRVGAMQESDIMGIPYPTKVGEDDDGRELKDMMFSTPQNFPRKGECGILFLDELSNAPIPNQHACYRLIHDRTIHNGSKLPDGVVVVAAGNTKEDKTGAKSIVPALARRFTAHFRIEPNIDDFIEYCFRNGIHSSIIGYINYNPGNLITTAASGEYGFACPANWVSASKILNNRYMTEDQKENGVTACLGTQVGQDFVGFLRNQQHMPNFEKIKKDGTYTLPKGADVDRGIMFTIISATAVHLMNTMSDVREGNVSDEKQEKQGVDNLSAVLDKFDDTTKGVCFRALKRADKSLVRDIMISGDYPNLMASLKSVIERTSKMD